MPLTRKVFAPGAPNTKIAKFSLGVMKPDYDVKVQLVAKQRAQIRHNALEAARIAINKKLGLDMEGNYHLLVKVYPHVILRENKMIATAGADRLQEGMRKAWGKPIGLAARVVDGTVLFELTGYKANLDKCVESMRGAASKLPITVRIVTMPAALQKQK